MLKIKNRLTSLDYVVHFFIKYSTKINEKSPFATLEQYDQEIMRSYFYRSHTNIQWALRALEERAYNLLIYVAKEAISQ